MALRIDDPVEEVAHDLQQAIPRILSEVGVPGASVTLIRDAQCAWSGGFGARNAQTREPVTTETVFEAYSCTKPLVAFRALQMCEDGSLELDTPLIHYLADPFVPGDARTELITLRMALSHTSGLPDDEDQRSIRFTPGDRWSYSTVGYYYVQQVIDHLTGLPFERNMLDNILAPLCMAQSSFVWQDRFLSSMAQGHLADGLPQRDRRIAVADADSLLTTAADYGRFIAHVLQAGTIGDSHQSTGGMAEMFREQIRISETLSWGLGWGIQETSDGNCIWHFGGGKGAPFQNFVLAFRDHGCGLVLLTNSENGPGVFEELVTLAIGGRYPVFPWSEFSNKHFGTRL